MLIKTFYDKNNEFHRLDGPAIEHPDGLKYWFRHGKRHREDGPAIIYPNGTMKYFINGNEVTELEVWIRCKKSLRL